MNEKLELAAKQINEILEKTTNGWYFVAPGKRALKWFKCYELHRLATGERAGYSISRTDARYALMAYQLDLDAMLAEAGLA